MKKKLIAKINDTDNNEILESIMRLLEIQPEEGVYLLNDTQLAAIEEAREDYRNGRFLTNEEANAEIEKWLKEFGHKLHIMIERAFWLIGRNEINPIVIV